MTKKTISNSNKVAEKVAYSESLCSQGGGSEVDLDKRKKSQKVIIGNKEDTYPSSQTLLFMKYNIKKIKRISREDWEKFTSSRETDGFQLEQKGEAKEDEVTGDFADDMS